VLRVVTIAVALAALAIPAKALAMAKPVASGTIRVNASVGQVRLGLPRAAVVRRIGDPLERYSKDDWGWDGAASTFGDSTLRAGSGPSASRMATRAVPPMIRSLSSRVRD